jgi:nicotinamide-nucleotide amidase
MLLDIESARLISTQLKSRGETIAVAESTTGGLISARLLAMPGASAYFLGGTVIYTRESSKVFLDAAADQLKGIKPLSEEMALYFARLVRDKLGASWGLAELGIAGPTGSPYGIDAGTSVIAIAGPVDAAVTVSTGHSDRIRNMEDFADSACKLLSEVLSGKQNLT